MLFSRPIFLISTLSKTLIVIIAFFVLGCGETLDEEYTSGTPKKGEQLFLIHCERCHGLDGTKGLNGAKNLMETQMDLMDITQIIKNGKGVMPSFKKTIPPGDLPDVVRYVNELKE